MRTVKRDIYIADEKLIISPIIDEDRSNYVELKRQINGVHTLFLNPVTKDLMWQQVVEGKDKTYSILTSQVRVFNPACAVVPFAGNVD